MLRRFDLLKTSGNSCPRATRSRSCPTPSNQASLPIEYSIVRGRQEQTVVDLFAGAGLLSGAFVSEGFRIVRAIEANEVASATYRRNLGDHVQVADIRRLRPEGRCDVLIAGPPCQGFSTLGKRNPRDSRNLLSLLVAEWACVLRPKVVVIENVATFLHSNVWESVRHRLCRAGYDVKAFILNALDFGVPQSRMRSFTLASRVGFCPIRPVDAERTSTTVREAWHGLSGRPNGLANHYAPRPSALARARMAVIPPGGDKRDVMRNAPKLTPPSWWGVRSEVTDVWGRMHPDRPSNTLRTAFQNPSKGRYLHPTQDRVISLREAARIQSISDDWAFVGLPTQIARQIGNSVPPLLGRAVARSVRASLR